MFQPLQEAYYFFRKNLFAICLVLFPVAIPVLLVQHLLSYIIKPTLIPIGIELVAQPFYTGALVFLLASLIQQKPWNAKQCYRASLQYWSPLFLLSLYCNTLVSFGFLALIVPGLWLFSRFAFVNFLTVLNQYSFRVAIDKSAELTERYRIPIMTTSGVLLALLMFFSFGAQKLIDQLALTSFWMVFLEFIIDLVGLLLIVWLDILLFRFFCLATTKTPQAF